jgi:type IV secretion system protein VirD4
MRSLLEKDELELDRLGEPDRRRAIFLISSDTDNTYQFLSALAVTLAIDLNMEKAYKKYGGRFPRHVRFELDELYALGYIPVIKHAITVVRSRNASMSMYVQSLKSIEELYKEAGVETLVDNCPTLLFLGTQNKETLEMFSQRTGEETVYARTIQRNFGDFGVQGTNESISGTGRKVKSVTQLALMDFDHIMSFVMGKYPIYDLKFDTPSHPLYSWIDPTEKRKFDQPQPHFSERFDYKKYKQRRDRREKK